MLKIKPLFRQQVSCHKKNYCFKTTFNPQRARINHDKIVHTAFTCFLTFYIQDCIIIKHFTVFLHNQTFMLDLRRSNKKSNNLQCSYAQNECVAGVRLHLCFLFSIVISRLLNTKNHASKQHHFTKKENYGQNT